MKKYILNFYSFKEYLLSPYQNGYIRDYALNATETDLSTVYEGIKETLKYCDNEEFITFKLQYLLKQKKIDDLTNDILFSCLMREYLCVGCSTIDCRFQKGEYEKEKKLMKEFKKCQR